MAIRGSRASALPFMVSAPVVNTSSSTPSTVSIRNQIGATCGMPFLRTVASLPVRVPCPTNASHSARSIVYMLTSKLGEHGVRETGPRVDRPLTERAIGERHARGPGLRVDPQEGAGLAEVPERRGRAVLAGPVRALVVA